MIGSIIGGVLGMAGANANAGAIGEASAKANAMTESAMRENRSDTSPWREGGISALSQIGRLMGWGHLGSTGQTGTGYNYTGDPTGSEKEAGWKDFFTSPGYTFRQGEGIKALDRSASAKGRLMSGAQIKGVQSFGEGLAADEYGSYMNQLMGLAGLGQQGNSTLVGANSGLASSGANNTMAGGIARGSAYQSGYNALASGIGSGINNTIGGAYLFRNKLGLS